MMTIIWNKTLYWEVSMPELEENNEFKKCKVHSAYLNYF